jgi:hypothetical protein
MKKLIVALALSCAANAYAAHDVPFSASIKTEPEPIGGTATTLLLSITGTGHASHFGALEIAGPLEVNLITGAQTGSSTLTAADGSTLVITFTGGTLFGPGGAATFQGTWEANSGTERFVGTSGGGSYHGSADGPTGVLYLDGTLSNPGKKK